MNEIYLDHASTTPIDPRVKQVIKTASFGNPGSFHTIGLQAKHEMDASRKKIALILNCNPKEIVFTSSGTESINLAIKGTVNKGDHIITTKTEHHAVLHTCEYLEKQEIEVTYLDVDKYGMVTADNIKKAIKKNTTLVSVMYANNEIGSINPINEIGELLKKYPQINFHTDACQAGRLNLNVKQLGVNLLSLNSSKIYGPKGVGILFTNTKLKPLIHGGGQENKLRSGTENVPGIAGFAKALEIIQTNKNLENKKLKKLSNKLIKGVLKKIPKCLLNGHPTKRLTSNANITFLDVEGEAIMLHLNAHKICVSSGSACTSHTLDPSHVILATGLPYEVAHGSIRFSLGRKTTEKDINKVLEVLPKIIESLRKISPVNLNITTIRK